MASSAALKFPLKVFLLQLESLRVCRSEPHPLSLRLLSGFHPTQLAGGQGTLTFELNGSLLDLASTPGPTEFVGPGSRCLILHGWSLGNAIAQKHHYDNAHKQLTVCCRSQELLLSTTSMVLTALGKPDSPDSSHA